MEKIMLNFFDRLLCFSIFCFCLIYISIYNTYLLFFSFFPPLDPTSQLGLAGATEAHWAAGYNSSYAAASYAAASSFAYSGSAASGAELAGQQTSAGLTDHTTSAASSSQIPTGKKLLYSAFSQKNLA